jgi:hypothetical protein
MAWETRGLYLGSDFPSWAPKEDRTGPRITHNRHLCVKSVFTPKYPKSLRNQAGDGAKPLRWPSQPQGAVLRAPGAIQYPKALLELRPISGKGSAHAGHVDQGLLMSTKAETQRFRYLKKKTKAHE